MESSIVPDNGKRMRELIGKWKYLFTLNFVTVEKFFYNTYFCVHFKKTNTARYLLYARDG